MLASRRHFVNKMLTFFLPRDFICIGGCHVPGLAAGLDQVLPPCRVARRPRFLCTVRQKDREEEILISRPLISVLLSMGGLGERGLQGPWQLHPAPGSKQEPGQSFRTGQAGFGTKAFQIEKTGN
jgi:hypothetical protein